jgi:DNA replication licensing factor MCM2
MVKEKYRFYQFKHQGEPSSIVIKISELEDRVRTIIFAITSLHLILNQVKDHEIHDVHSFLSSKLFQANGYQKENDTIVKHFVEVVKDPFVDEMQEDEE